MSLVPPVTIIPRPNVDQKYDFVLSQETACEWINCLLKTGVDIDNEENICRDTPKSCLATYDIALNMGVYDFGLPSCDGKTICSLANLTCENTIWLVTDPCTPCGRKIQHYIKLLRAIITEVYNVTGTRPVQIRLRKNPFGACFCGS